MHEPSDGIAEEVERQLQLTLTTAAIAARRTIAARQRAIEQARRDSEQAAREVKAQIGAERQLAAAHLQPVFDPGWWETASPRDVADMWQHANSWREPDTSVSPPTTFDRAAGRIHQEVRGRTGLDPTEVLALAAVQELEHEHQTTTSEHDPAPKPAQLATVEPDLPTPRGFDDRERRHQLRAGLVAAGVPEPAIEARTLADLGQARQPAEAAHTPVAASGPRPAARSADRGLQRRR